MAKLNISFSSTYCRLHEQEIQSWVSQNDNNPSLFHKWNLVPVLKYHIFPNRVFLKPPNDLRKADITGPNDQIWLLDNFIFLVGSIIKCNSFLHSLKHIYTFYLFLPLAELNSDKHLKKWHNSSIGSSLPGHWSYLDILEEWVGKQGVQVER